MDAKVQPHAAIPPELALLLACCRIQIRKQDEFAIREILKSQINWTVFARKATSHGLACLAGNTLARVAPDLVPTEILDAFGVLVKRMRDTNSSVFAELARVLETLSACGIKAIPLKGPTLAFQAYGDIGFRVFRDLDFLVHDADLDRAVKLLQDLGYGRGERLTAKQIANIQRLNGQDFLFSKFTGIVFEPHTRLTPIKMALDIDYTGLWRRAENKEIDGHHLLLLAPEDTFLVLSIHGGKEMWWNIKWACDIAAFIESHPTLDWNAVTGRARAQGCLRMVLLAATLAETHFGSILPDAIKTLQRAHVIGPMAGRIGTAWITDQPMDAPSHRVLSMDRLLLHDGLWQQTRYVMKTLLLPGPHHVAAMPLPFGLIPYVPLKLAHDLVALPLWRVYQLIRGKKKPVARSAPRA